jgi:hypothetical protein
MYQVLEIFETHVLWCIVIGKISIGLGFDTVIGSALFSFAIITFFFFFCFMIVGKVYNINGTLYRVFYKLVNNVGYEQMKDSVVFFRVFGVHIFIFIMVNNLIGLAPMGYPLTSQFVVMFLSFTVCFEILLIGIFNVGYNLLYLFVPYKGTMPFLVLPFLGVIELVSYCMRFFFKVLNFLMKNLVLLISWVLNCLLAVYFFLSNAMKKRLVPRPKLTKATGKKSGSYSLTNLIQDMEKEVAGSGSGVLGAAGTTGVEGNTFSTGAEEKNTTFSTSVEGNTFSTGAEENNTTFSTGAEENNTTFSTGAEENNTTSSTGGSPDGYVKCLFERLREEVVRLAQQLSFVVVIKYLFVGILILGVGYLLYAAFVNDPIGLLENINKNDIVEDNVEEDGKTGGVKEDGETGGVKEDGEKDTDKKNIETDYIKALLLHGLVFTIYIVSVLLEK